MKNITVTLPEGLRFEPVGGGRPERARDAQVGFKGENPETGAQEFAREVYDPETNKDEATLCPNASKIANVTIKTPLLPNPLKGFVYLAAPQNFRDAPPENPFKSLVAMYLVAEDPVSGTLVKLPGKRLVDEATGQIIATFANNPQLPFEDAELEFFGGERAPLATPARCGVLHDERVVRAVVRATNRPSVSHVRHHSGPKTTRDPNGTPCPGAACRSARR